MLALPNFVEAYRLFMQHHQRSHFADQKQPDLSISVHILMVVTTDLTYDQRMTRIATALANYGFKVLLVGRNLPSSIPITTDQHIYQAHRLNCWFSRGTFFYLEYQLRLFWLVFWAKVSIVSAADIDTLPGALLGQKLSVGFRQKRIAFDAHEIFSEQEEVVQRGLIKRVWAQLERICIPQVDAAYTVSQGVANWYRQHLGVSFAVIRNLPDASLHIINSQAVPLITASNYLLYVGAVNKNRGLEHVIASMAFHTLSLVICGDGPDLVSLKALAIRLGVAVRITFKGYVRPHDLQPIYEAAYLGVLLLDGKGLNYQYSLANKFFDYMSAGLPQLVSPLPEYVSILEDHPFGLVCNPDAQSIANVINQLLAHPDQYQQLKQACVEARPQFTWQHESAKLIKLYTDLLAD